ncbi:glycerol-3-phosphate responsive antiterminator [Anaeromicrobium sediminis]|nr:glycerol-3-phosphate responsive antiterminator [Anaeromicrobium sediminis]
MKKNLFYDKIQENPMIAAIRNIEDVDKVIKSPCEICFLLSGDIFNLKGVIQKLKESDKLVYVHVDLLEGFSKDTVALRYIYENMKPDGIITTKTHLIKKARTLGIFAIQRLFILDTISLETGIKTAKSIQPDAIEILPGIIPKIIKKLKKEINIPVIAGGLISDKEDIIEGLKAGAMGISASNEKLWYM